MHQLRKRVSGGFSEALVRYCVSSLVVESSLESFDGSSDLGEISFNLIKHGLAFISLGMSLHGKQRCCKSK